MNSTVEAVVEYVRGDITGVEVPAHPEALRIGGEAFLTQAFRAFGSISPSTRVARITRFDSCPGGSTGQKLFLSVEYDGPQESLHADLFVKFSRDFTDSLRDRARYEMESEVRFAAVSRQSHFPVSVPKAYFADYDHASGTGILITQRIAFGSDGVDPQREKCLDYELDDALSYYRAIITSLARLAGTHKAGGLSADVDGYFPFSAAAAAASDPIRHSQDQLRQTAERYADFAASCPQLLPENIRTPEFLARIGSEAGRFLTHEATIKRFLQSNPDLIALCHWNANIDNAWFWRDAAGTLQCGLMDWGRVGQMNVAYALWGCLSGAGLEIWNERLDELLDLFVREFQASGGPAIDAAELELHLQLYVATMGIAWLLDAPARIRHRLPEVMAATGPRDPLFRRSESARNQLHISTNFLNYWQRSDFGAALDRLMARNGA